MSGDLTPNLQAVYFPIYKSFNPILYIFKVVDRWLSLMSTQATPRATLIFHGKFDMEIHGILCKNPSR